MALIYVPDRSTQQSTDVIFPLWQSFPFSTEPHHKYWVDAFANPMPSSMTGLILVVMSCFVRSRCTTYSLAMSCQSTARLQLLLLLLFLWTEHGMGGNVGRHSSDSSIPLLFPRLIVGWRGWVGGWECTIVASFKVSNSHSRYSTHSIQFVFGMKLHFYFHPLLLPSFQGVEF